MAPEELSNRDQSLYRFYVVQDSLFYLISEIRERDWKFNYNLYAEGLVQKACLQLMTMRKVFERGEWYSALFNKNLKYAPDSLSVAGVLRGAYEIMITFNHVYINPASEEEIELRYLLWALDTLISKDKAQPTDTEEGKQGRKQVREKINETIDHLLTLPIVRSLDEDSQAKIKAKSAPKAKEEWHYIEGNKLKVVDRGWHGLVDRIPAQAHTFDNLYKLLSLNAHPTWHSADVMVNGFELTEQDSENFLIMDLMIHMGSVIGAFILYDYCTMFKEVHGGFGRLPPLFQDTINGILQLYKGEQFRL